jgi:hypothetical protein
VFERHARILCQPLRVIDDVADESEMRINGRA